MHNYKIPPLPPLWLHDKFTSTGRVDFMLKCLDRSCAVNSAHIHMERAQMGEGGQQMGLVLVIPM